MTGKKRTISTHKPKGRSVLGEKKLRDEEPREEAGAPHSFVLSRGTVGPYLKRLVKDFRKIMEPYTASSLKVTRRNKTRDFVSVAGLLHVTHTVMFTRTDQGINLKMACTPRGPTLSFKVHNYTLSSDIASFSKKHCVFLKQFESSPLIVLNGFSGSGRHLCLMTKMFQNMFPAINLLKVDLKTVRRCLLFNYDAETKLIDIRHYAIKIVPTGVSRGVKKLLVNKVPNLSHYNDISDFIKNPTLLSESEGEDDKSNVITVPEKLAFKGNVPSGVSAIRLSEIGPRLTIQLIKAETDFLSGDVLYHDYIEKSEEEVKQIKEKIQERKDLKQKRRKIQEENVKRKLAKKARMTEQPKKGSKGKSDKDNENEEEEEEDENEWFRKEVGEDPDPDLFPVSQEEKMKSAKKFKGSVKSKKVSFTTGPKIERFKKKPFKRDDRKKQFKKAKGKR